MEEPTKLTETEAKAGSKTAANRWVMAVSLISVVVIFVALLLVWQ